MINEKLPSKTADFSFLGRDIRYSEIEPTFANLLAKMLMDIAIFCENFLGKESEVKFFGNLDVKIIDEKWPFICRVFSEAIADEPYSIEDGQPYYEIGAEMVEMVAEQIEKYADFWPEIANDSKERRANQLVMAGYKNGAIHYRKIAKYLIENPYMLTQSAKELF